MIDKGPTGGSAWIFPAMMLFLAMLAIVIGAVNQIIEEHKIEQYIEDQISSQEIPSIDVMPKVISKAKETVFVISGYWGKSMIAFHDFTSNGTLDKVVYINDPEGYIDREVHIVTSSSSKWMVWKYRYAMVKKTVLK